MLLTVDIGNTTVAIAGLRGDRVAFVKKLPSDPALDWTASLQDLLEGVEAKGAVLSSVVPALTGPVGEGLKAITGKPVLVVDKTTDTGLDLSGYDTANLGMDRAGTLVAEGRVIRAGRSICLAAATVTPAAGKLLAHGTSKLMLLAGKQAIRALLAAEGTPDLPPKFL